MESSDLLIAEKLLDKSEISQNTIDKLSASLSSQIRLNQLQVIELVKRLDPILTNGDNTIRLRGVLILTQVITSLPKELLSAKEIEVLQEFLNLRLVDHKSMEQPVLKCLSYFVDNNNKPEKFNKNLLEFLKTKVNVHQMDSKSRLVVYEICKKIILERRSRTKTIDSDLVYSTIQMIEGENKPQNLMICFSIVTYIMKNFDELEPYKDDLFEWLASYYPIDYTPTDSEGGAIGRADLVAALEECFFASPLNSENLQTLLLEKLEASDTPFKIESLRCLIKCYEIFPLTSVKDYASTLWTSIRMNCLKKLDIVNQELLNTCYMALSALSSKLSQDRELYMTFVIDLYEELAIAFRKPEMDLFEPAAGLIVNAALPRQDGFDYILDKILPMSLNAIKDNELRPIPGLVYLFDKFIAQHGDLNLKSDITTSICNIVSSLNARIAEDDKCLELINSLVKGRVNFDVETLNTLKEKLLNSIDQSPLDVEGSLALIEMNYSPPETIGNLLNSVNCYKLDGEKKGDIEFAIYLRRVVLTLNTVPIEQLTDISNDLGPFLDSVRKLSISQKVRQQSIENVGRLHAIIFNKLSNEVTDSLLIELFQSKFCQNFIPSSTEDASISAQMYVPVIKWVLKSLVLRNHQLVMPIVNLLLNFISSDKVDVNIALTIGKKVFEFIFAENHSDLFKKENNYKIFALYKQKFYTQASKEIKVRLDSPEMDLSKKHVIVCLLALQIPYLPAGAYKKDSQWMIRELLKILQSFKVNLKTSMNATDGEIISVIYDCMSSFIGGHASDDLQGHLNTIVELSLLYACEASSLELRRKSLICLTEIASGIDEKKLLPLRSGVVDRLRICLSDKKRLVRQEAASARLRWVLVGQPVGG